MAGKWKNGHNGSHEETIVGSLVEEGDMVLRTVFVPPEMDQSVRNRADQEHVSQGEIVRRAISSYLER